MNFTGQTYQQTKIRSQTMSAKFTLSIDCEGKWGIADRSPKRLEEITSKELTNAYQEILDILDRYQLKATFGFVSALCMEKDWLRYRLESNEDLMLYRNSDWLKEPKEAYKKNNLQGWSEPQLVKMVIADGRHDICSHGGFHLPYDEVHTPKLCIAKDIEAIKDLENEHKIRLNTMIFPRNIIGYHAELAKAGIEGFRDIDPTEAKKGKLGKLLRLKDEFITSDKFCEPKQSESNQRIQSLSSAKFLNAKIGIRKLIPTNITMHRMEKLLESAITDNRHMHIYTHPHNLISDPSMPDKLRHLAKIVKEREKEGKVTINTIGEDLNERKKTLHV